MKAKGGKMSIWKTPDQKPEERRQILFYVGCGGLLNKGWYYTKNDAFGSYSSKNVQKWAYVDELFAQADKAERLQEIAERQNDILQDHFAVLGHRIGKEVMDMCDEINNW